MVNRYANDMMARKYRKAVTKVRMVLSDARKECIFSMRSWILRVKNYRYEKLQLPTDGP
jgi:hypothetical protein